MDSYSTLTPCTTVGGYTPPCQETPTPMEVCGSSYQQECIQSLGREEKDKDDVDHGRDEYEEMIGRDDSHENTINYENVDNVRHDVMEDHDDDAIEFQDDIGDGIEVARQALIVYSMNNNKNYITERSNQQRLCVKCANESYAWKVRAFSQRKLNGLWAVTIYGGPHTCPSVGVNKDDKMMDSNFLAKELHTYAIANIHGNWEESYQKLQKLLLAYKDSDPGTQVSFRSINGDIPVTIIFKYGFCAFAPSIARFAHCRPVISIDGTHLYGKYKGKLLIAMATIANNEIFSLAFAVVDDEMGASWGWFLSWLQTAIRDAVPDSGICIISDRHRGIISSIAQWPNDYVPDTSIKIANLKKILDCLKEVELKFSKDPNPNIAKKKPYSYLMKECLEKWTLSHDGGRRYGAMTTNMSKYFNGVLKGARGLPISALVDYIWCKLVAYFNDRCTKILGDIEHGQKFRKHAMEKHEANYKKRGQDTI
ncbi:uncharacterized protein LOC115964681 [Quercus lobata]|uniref:uncharacterized protein LOC115964681 n=1 Tax=Quercus lobata TaxID=97700 RepID=UPI0012443333|nr:uncharacterized protein LOC115964681 [Quercus lobata]